MAKHLQTACDDCGGALPRPVRCTTDEVLCPECREWRDYVEEPATPRNVAVPFDDRALRTWELSGRVATGA